MIIVVSLHLVGGVAIVWVTLSGEASMFRRRVGVIVVIMCSSALVRAVSLSDIVEHVTSTQDTSAIISQTADGARVTKLSLRPLVHQDMLDIITDSETITREQFAYLLDLVTPAIETVRDLDTCQFDDYDAAQSLWGIGAVQTLCHKGIVHGAHQSYYFAAKLTEAEAVTMVIRARLHHQTETLTALEHSGPAEIRYRPYYRTARELGALTNSIDHAGSLDALTPLAAIALLEHNFGPLDSHEKRHPLIQLMYQTMHDEQRARLVWWVYDVQGEQIHIDDDSVRISLDPYRSTIEDEQVSVIRQCASLDECMTRIEFEIAWEENRSRYCGTIDYVIDAPYEKSISDYFCLDR